MHSRISNSEAIEESHATVGTTKSVMPFQQGDPQRPYFTVVVPLFNKREYVQRCVDSILGQTFGDFEVLVVDDGSTDGSGDLVLGYADPRIRLIRQANGGVSSARNRGIVEAQGKWVAFLDADDEWLPKFLERVAVAIGAYPEAGAVYTLTAHMRGEQLVKAIRIVAEHSVCVNIFDLAAFNSGPEMNSSCTVIRADIFRHAGLFPVGFTIGEDTDMWLRVAWCTQVVHVPEVLAVYDRQASESDWHKCKGEPHWVSTYHEWLRQGRIPPHLIRSSASMYQISVVERALRQGLNGGRLAALGILAREIDWSTVPKRSLASALCWILLPGRMIREGKRILGWWV